MKDVKEQLDQLNRNLRQFQINIQQTVDDINNKIEKKHIPISLEQDILTVAQQSIHEAIKSVLTGYNNPLSKLIIEVINRHSVELKAIINDAFETVIRTEDFKQSILSGFSHKIARTIISNNDGLFDKVSNELKQDSVFRSKITIAISNVVEECLKEKS
jgi:hypothetical protein